MICKMTQIAMFALSLMAFTASAQSVGKQETSKGSVRPSIVHTEPWAKGRTINVNEVLKKDAAAKPNPHGSGRLVPVEIFWDTKIPAGAKLIELKCILRTRNTDGKTSTIEHLIEVDKFVSGSNIKASGTILLPMAEGVFAKEFTLTMKGKFGLINASGFVSQIEFESVTKSGRFEVLAEKK